MSYSELSEDVVFDVASKAAKTDIAIRENITQVENALTEFEKLSAGLAELAERFPPDLVYDVTTGKGMVEAVAHRAAWREPRLAVERLRKQAKAPVLTLGKDIDARAAWLTEQLLIGERPIDQLIKAEEARKEAIKQARIDAEAGRIIAIQEAIAEINMAAMGAAGKPSTDIAEELERVRTMPLDEAVYQEMMPQAVAAQAATVAKLDIALKAALHTEAEAARLAAERVELEELRKAAAEQKARDEAAARAEQQRVAAEQAERQRVLDEQAAAAAAQQAEATRALAEQQMEIDRQRAELEAQRAPVVIEPPAPPPAEPVLIAPVRATPIAEVAWINTATLSERVGVPMNGALAEEVGYPGTKRTGPGLFWLESDITPIGLALIERIRERIGQAAKTA